MVSGLGESYAESQTPKWLIRLFGELAAQRGEALQLVLRLPILAPLQ